MFFFERFALKKEIKRALFTGMDLTQGNVWKKMIRFTLPIILTMILQQAYVMADSLVVSNCIGETALAIISPSSQTLAVFQCVSLGIQVAVGIIIANLAGAKDFKGVKNASSTFLWISVITGVLLTGLSMVLGYPIFLFLNVPEEIFQEAYSLYFIYAVSLFTGILGSVLTTILMSLGDSKRPFIISSFGGILNVGLDLLFIQVFKWGIASCAYATLSSQALVALLAYILVKVQLKRLEDSKASFSWAYGKEMIRLGVPSIIQQAVMSLGSLAIVSLIYSFGTEIIAGNVAAEEINSLLFIPGVAVTNAYATFASQNYGARNQKRIEEGFKVMQVLGLIVNTVVALISIFSTRYFVYLFTGSFDSDSSIYAFYYLMFCIPYYYFIVFKYGFDSLFKAKKQIQLFIYSSFINLALRIALAYLFAYTLGVNFINLSMPISTLLSGFANLLFWKYSKRYRQATEAIKEPVKVEEQPQS